MTGVEVTIERVGKLRNLLNSAKTKRAEVKEQMEEVVDKMASLLHIDEEENEQEYLIIFDAVWNTNYSTEELLNILNIEYEE